MCSISMGRIIGLSNKIRLISLSTNQFRNLSFSTPNIIKKVCEECGLPEPPIKYGDVFRYFCNELCVGVKFKYPHDYFRKSTILWHATSDAEKQIWRERYNEECKKTDKKMKKYIDNLSEECIIILRYKLMTEYRTLRGQEERKFVRRNIQGENAPQLLDQYNYYKTFMFKNKKKVCGSKINNRDVYDNLTENEKNELRTNYAAYNKKIIDEYAAWQDRIISEGKQYLFRMRMKKIITL